MQSLSVHATRRKLQDQNNLLLARDEIMSCACNDSENNNGRKNGTSAYCFLLLIVEEISSSIGELSGAPYKMRSGL